MEHDYYKQIIVIRKDLKMRLGKCVAQSCHASLKATLENMEHPSVIEWLSGQFTKIAVSVDSEQELFDILQKAKDAGLITALITDSGKTEFHGVPTNTCIAIGPALHSELSPITGNLKLL